MSASNKLSMFDNINVPSTLRSSKHQVQTMEQILLQSTGRTSQESKTGTMGSKSRKKVKLSRATPTTKVSKASSSTMQRQHEVDATLMDDPLLSLQVNDLLAYQQYQQQQQQQ